MNENIADYGGNMDTLLTRVQVSHTGNIYWGTPIILQVNLKTLSLFLFHQPNRQFTLGLINAVKKSECSFAMVEENFEIGYSETP